MSRGAPHRISCPPAEGSHRYRAFVCGTGSMCSSCVVSGSRCSCSPPLPPSQPPAPSPLACEDNNIPGLGSYWCKLNTHYATEAASERFCNDKKFKVKCKKTCGLCN